MRVYIVLNIRLIKNLKIKKVYIELYSKGRVQTTNTRFASPILAQVLQYNLKFYGNDKSSYS